MIYKKLIWVRLHNKTKLQGYQMISNTQGYQMISSIQGYQMISKVKDYSLLLRVPFKCK